MTLHLRTLRLASTLLVVSASIASAQRGSTRGTAGVPRAVTSPPQSASHAPPPPSNRGYITGPRLEGPRGPRGGDVPRVVTHQGYGYMRGTRVGSNYGGGTTAGVVGSGYGTVGTMNGFGGRRFDPGSSHRWRPGYTRFVGTGCIGGCFMIGVGGRSARFFGSFLVGYPFVVPVVVPYFYSPVYEQRYVEQPVVEYAPDVEASRAASKLIVVGGGTGGGGDALTIESIGDSVRLNWLGAGRAAREVKLFVADSAQRQLATRIASAAAPTATFEVATLSAPVAFAGVTVTFTDGVTTTTMVPYRSQRR